VSIMEKVSSFVKSLTSERANDDTPAGVEAPDPDGGAVDMHSDRKPMAGFEPDSDGK